MQPKQSNNPDIRVSSVMVTKATFGVPTTTSAGVPGRLRVALKYSSSSTVLSSRVFTASVTVIVPAWMNTSKDPPE